MPERPDFWKRGDQEVSLARLYAIRIVSLLFIISGFFVHPQWLLHPDPTNRGMILAFTGGLWVMAFLVLRYPLQMLPIFLFEFVWKTMWLLRFGLPQWLAGTGSPRLSQDMIEIGLVPFVLGLIIPWGYVWRHYIQQPADPWR